MSNSESLFIKTILQFNEDSFKEKGSTFTGQVFHVETVEAVQEILAATKKKYYDATHRCYGFLLADDTFKYSDDGEPSGSAGVRIYNAIQHFDLKNVLVISIRYFGGTKLGVGPLGKAYYKSAHDVLDKAKIITQTYFNKIKINYDYNHTKSIHHFLGNYSTRDLNPGFDTAPFMECNIEPKDIDPLTEDLAQATNGQTKISTIEKNILIKT